MAQFEFDGILLETGLLQTGFHAAGPTPPAPQAAHCDGETGARSAGQVRRCHKPGRKGRALQLPCRVGIMSRRLHTKQGPGDSARLLKLLVT